MKRHATGSAADVVELQDATVIDSNEKYVHLAVTVAEGVDVEGWVRRSKIKGGWQLQKSEVVDCLTIRKMTAVNKGFCPEGEDNGV